ncbi:MAG: META domain-containing protein [Pseudomonadota bacterium]
MKKRLHAATAGLLLLVLSGCGGGEDNNESSSAPNGASQDPSAMQPDSETNTANSDDNAAGPVARIIEIPPEKVEQIERLESDEIWHAEDKIVLWKARPASGVLDVLPPDEELIARVWALERNRDARIKLDEGVLAGVTGCNNVTGNYELGEDSRIEFVDIATTKMQCSEEVMEIESEMISVIRAAYFFTVNRTELVFFDAYGRRLVFEQLQ